MKVNTHLNLAQRLRVSGVLHPRLPTPLYLAKEELNFAASSPQRAACFIHLVHLYCVSLPKLGEHFDVSTF